MIKRTLALLLLFISTCLPQIAFTAEQVRKNIPHFNELNDPVFKQIIDIYQNKQGSEWVSAMSQLLDEDVVMLQWKGKQTMPIRGRQAIQTYLNHEVKEYSQLKKQVGRFMVAGGRVGGSQEPFDSVLILFYQASTSPLQQKPWVWAGCDVITIKHGKIVDWRVEEDTYMKLIKHPESIDIQHEYEIIDKYWHPTTTTNNLVGMAYILDLKRTVMPTVKRGQLLLERLTDNIEQSTWEPTGILYLKGKTAVKAMFFDGLLAILPDFYENVERVLVAGNAFIMMQNPSGTQTLSNGRNHRAWYNCDIYFFEGPNISALLFQRDTQMDIAEEKKGIHQ
ncbi:SnoaL-like domain protein [Legionella gratiana]|uniref:SnoaL-like domain n=1 Tax=Legionella gratiana TaxID=45066 RepID=A0A378JH38_9GAMM|nr:nuclear transport factor 2 family protein [Legionella gratiana]KTD13581.1 SnoaL-like domain protein [Legionella gratiana]STX46177.1 SnoaL-like domain [Legionella gratiana]